MATKFIQKLKNILVNREFEKQIDESKKYRKESEDRIGRMIADLNGCSDQWFLTVRSKLDECIPRDDTGDSNGF